LTLIKDNCRESFGLSGQLIVSVRIAGKEILQDSAVRCVGHGVGDILTVPMLGGNFMRRRRKLLEVNKKHWQVQMWKNQRYNNKKT
jgi:hypothetical protein